MNADEIVRALRGYAKNAQENFETDSMRDFDSAAALIESLQTQLTDYHHMSELVDGKMAENQRLRRINENLQSKLAASQRREQAAEEDLKISAYCRTCSKKCGLFEALSKRDNEGGCKDFEWRGPGAGEGETE